MPKVKERKYTVVGLYPDTNEDFVEWVEAESVEDAIANAVVMADGRDEAAIIAVFAGHHLDLGKGSLLSLLVARPLRHSG